MHHSVRWEANYRFERSPAGLKKKLLRQTQIDRNKLSHITNEISLVPMSHQMDPQLALAGVGLLTKITSVMPHSVDDNHRQPGLNFILQTGFVGFLSPRLEFRELRLFPSWTSSGFHNFSPSRRVVYCSVRLFIRQYFSWASQLHWIRTFTTSHRDFITRRVWLLDFHANFIENIENFEWTPVELRWGFDDCFRLDEDDWSRISSAIDACELHLDSGGFGAVLVVVVELSKAIAAEFCRGEDVVSHFVPGEDL